MQETRRLAALALVFLLGCSTPAAPPAQDPDDDGVLQSREALGDPMVDLAEAVIALSKGLDQARFEVGRGADMKAAVRALEARRDAADNARAVASDAAASVPLPSAGDIVATAAEQTETLLPAVDDELAYLRQVAGLDQALFDVAATWDEPGSQTEIRERLLDLAADVNGLRPQVRKLRPVPQACGAMEANRREWIATLRKRTLALQEQANSAGGSTFDELRKSYRALPFAVEPRTADRADRECWLKESQAPATADRLRASVEALRAELSR